MNTKIGRFPCSVVEFTKEGAVHDRGQVEALLARIGTEGWEDLVVISHGWKNDSAEAGALYEELLTNADALLDGDSYGGLAGRRIGVLAVFWPSKKFTDAELIVGGGASVASADARFLEELAAVVEYSAREDAEELGARARQLWSELAESEENQNEFVQVIETLLDDGTDQGGVTEELELHPEEESGAEFLERLADVELEDEDAEFEGGAAGLGDLFGGIKKGGARFLNQLTYFKMKKRAGMVGEGGLRDVLALVAGLSGAPRIHLAGHSFGGRVVSAAAKALADSGLQLVETVTLLQAAFSHHGFARKFDGDRDGYFRPVVTRGAVKRLIAVTHTHNDRANLTAYPLASRMHGADSSALGDAGDRFGAIGANGAIRTPEASFHEMRPAGSAYGFGAERVQNFRADGSIRDHGDVRNRAVAHLLLSVISGA